MSQQSTGGVAKLTLAENQRIALVIQPEAQIDHLQFYSILSSSMTGNKQSAYSPRDWQGCCGCCHSYLQWMTLSARRHHYKEQAETKNPQDTLEYSWHS